jgi:hypothetical protein
MRTIALETFKIIHKKSPLFLQDIFIKNNIYNFRYINTADIPRPRTTKYGKKTNLSGMRQQDYGIHRQVRIFIQNKYVNSKLKKGVVIPCQERLVFFYGLRLVERNH